MFQVPAPKRGEIVRQIAHRLRDNISNLGKLVSILFLVDDCPLQIAVWILGVIGEWKDLS